MWLNIESNVYMFNVVSSCEWKQQTFRGYKLMFQITKLGKWWWYIQCEQIQMSKEKLAFQVHVTSG